MAIAPKPEHRPAFDQKRVNEDMVRRLRGQQTNEDTAMAEAIGGSFDLMGRMQVGLLRHYGLKPDGYLIDVGCGAGRLAQPLSRYLTGRYLGIDLVGDLVDYARRTTERPDWTFKVVDRIEIPERDGQADMVCIFSVLTHLPHEQSYWYLEEAKRVLKPGGRIVASFLEFRDDGHWSIFESSLAGAKAGAPNPLNVFMDREGIITWSNHLGLWLEEIRAGSDAIVPEGALGQSLFVLTKADPASLEKSARSRFALHPDIPSDFDPDFYLDSYPDLVAAGVDPYRHYATFGKTEGRRYKPG